MCYGKYRKFQKPKISHFIEKNLVISVVCSNCKKEDEKIFKEEESIELLKILGLITDKWLKKKTRIIKNLD